MPDANISPKGMGVFIMNEQKKIGQLIDLSNGTLDEIKVWATENNLIDQFNEDFSKFDRFINNGYDVEIYYDWADHSLAFLLKLNGIPNMNGGFIFHAPNGAENFTVSVDPITKPRWSIHT